MRICSLSLHLSLSLSPTLTTLASFGRTIRCRENLFSLEESRWTEQNDGQDEITNERQQTDISFVHLKITITEVLLHELEVEIKVPSDERKKELPRTNSS